MTSSPLTGPRGYARARAEAASFRFRGGGAANDEGSSRDGAPSSSSSSSSFVRTVDGRPYLPLLAVDPSDESTAIEAARAVVSCYNNDETDDGTRADAANNDDNDVDAPAREGRVAVITGGLTNALFKVDLPDAPGSHSSVLVRVFGAEGMIDRDLETANFARLCGESHSGGIKVVHDKLDLVGRFANGRVETWIPDMRQAHHVEDFGREGLGLEVARQLARLHYGFDANASDGDSSGSSPAADAGSTNEGSEMQPTLWKVMESWIEELSQALSREQFRDPPLAKLFSRASIAREGGNSSPTPTSVEQSLSSELAWLKGRAEARFPNAPVVFCHNDVNAANVLLHSSIDGKNKDGNNGSYNRDTVVIIDYEYGAANYAMYDVANYVCEHCGGNDNGVPDYGLLPSSGRMERFLEEYVNERDGILSANGQGKEKDGNGAAARCRGYKATVSDLHAQVDLFQMASNLYWGIWGILQAAGEVADGTFKTENAASRLDGTADMSEWDNLRYGKNRLERYRSCKGLMCAEDKL